VDIQILSRGGGFTTFRLVGPGPAVAAARAHVDGLVTSLAVEQSGGQSSQKENPFFRRHPKENGGNDEEKGDRAESVATSGN
jgi:hypothetical protein